MNCANHPDRERAAFCQNCGKPLCGECVRNLGTSVYCEPCLTARTAGPIPPGGYSYPGQPYPGPAGYPPPGSTGYPPPGSAPLHSAPNPGLAALLGLIPGVGAMYNEQYAKGIVHLMVFAVLVSLASDVNGIFGLFVAGWICYMAIEAYHTARARRDGTPLPNPFGLNDLSERLGFGRAWPSSGPHPADPGAVPAPGPTAPGFVAPVPESQPPNPPNPSAPPYSYDYAYTPPTAQWAAPPDATAYGVPPVPPVPPMPPYPAPDPSYYRRFPSAAVWLIVLGSIFLLGNIPGWHIIRGRLLVPIFLIGLGVWIFVRRMTGSGCSLEDDGSPYYHYRLRCAINGGLWWVIVGVIWMLDALHILTWSHSWPLFLIVAGVMMFAGRAMAPGYRYVPPPSGPPAPPATTTDLAPIDNHAQPRSDHEEGR